MDVFHSKQIRSFATGDTIYSVVKDLHFALNLGILASSENVDDKLVVISES